MAESTENTIPTVSDPWADYMRLAAKVTVDLPVAKFNVRELLRLEKGSLVETRWKEGTHLPLQVNGRHIGWVEFEVVGDRLGVQVTELA